MKSQSNTVATFSAMHRKSHCGTCLYLCTPALISLCLVLPIAAVGQARYSVTDLGTLGGNNSVPIWITNSGDVIGFSDTGKVDGAGHSIQHAFVWRRGEGCDNVYQQCDDVRGMMQDLGTLGGNNSLAFGGNDEGQIVGYADVPGGATSHAALWYKGMITDLGTFAGPDGFSFAQLINNKHKIVGGSTTSDSSFHGFLWDDGVMTDLGTLGGPNSFGNGINERGHIVGGATVSDIVNPILGFPPYYGTLWDDDEIVNLTSGTPAAAFNINNRSQVVGRLLVPDPLEGGVAHAFLWHKGVLTDLGVPAGDDNSEANSLNDNGQIVGDAGVGFIETYTQDRALLWQNGVRYDLNTLIPGNSGYHLIVAAAVNASGEIVVSAVQLNTGNVHAALLTPQHSDVVATGVKPTEPSEAAAWLSDHARRLLNLARSLKVGFGARSN